MAWLPGAIVKEVTRHRTPMARYDGVCNHIAVSNGASLFNYFNQPGNPTSHFYVRKTAPAGATMADFEQYVDTRYRAPANLQGNPRLISIETQGGVGDDLNAGWTPLQLERIAWIVAQCHTLHGIPLIAMPNSLPSTRGLGYHRLGVDPWRVDGGELWSTAYGKVCPGPTRINQQGVILARARAIVNGDTDMPLTDEDVARIWSYKVGPTGDQESVGTIQYRIDPGSAGLPALVRDAVWQYLSTSALDSSPVKAIDLLRYAQGDSKTAKDILVDEDAQTDRIETKLDNLGDVPTLAASIVAQLPPGADAQAAAEAAIRHVLGGLDQGA